MEKLQCDGLFWHMGAELNVVAWTVLLVVEVLLLLEENYAIRQRAVMPGALMTMNALRLSAIAWFLLEAVLLAVSPGGPQTCVLHVLEAIPVSLWWLGGAIVWLKLRSQGRTDVWRNS